MSASDRRFLPAGVLSDGVPRRIPAGVLLQVIDPVRGEPRPCFLSAAAALALRDRYRLGIGQCCMEQTRVPAGVEGVT